jgi:hypothetical protein
LLGGFDLLVACIWFVPKSEPHYDELLVLVLIELMTFGIAVAFVVE